MKKDTDKMNPWNKLIQNKKSILKELGNKASKKLQLYGEKLKNGASDNKASLPEEPDKAKLQQDGLQVREDREASLEELAASSPEAAYKKLYLPPAVYSAATLIYLEIMLHFLNYRGFDDKIIYPIFFALPTGLLIGFLAGLFRPKRNRVFLSAVIGLICLLFSVQLIYFYNFKVYFSFQTIGLAGDAFTNFWEEILRSLQVNFGGLILIFLPVIILMFLGTQFIDYRKKIWKEQAGVLIASIAVYAFAMLSLLIYGKNDYSPYDLYFRSKVPELSGKQLGILTMTRIDIGGLFDKDNDLVLADTITLDQIETPVTKAPTQAPAQNEPKDNTGDSSGSQTPAPTSTPTPIPIDTSPNIMNIDFNALAEKESSDTIKTLHQYFASATPTNKNEYTGYFKGYNLIQITAEGFSPYAIDKEKTPTLYKLVREGFVFNNFYTALWQTSTSDGEYVALTGLIPLGTRSMYHGRKNLWPFTMGHQFNLLGIKSRAYHNHTYTYYQRDETHPNLGYRFTGKGNGLELENPDIWPESDLEMINSTVDDYVGEELFHTYYLTVSGHMNYNFTGNMMAYKNRDIVADLPYSDDAKAYIACQLELDRALEKLIRLLEEAGVADRTVIALSADHYPYGWEKYKLDELAGHEIEPNFEIYRNQFILWSKGMKENVVIDEPCSSMDILPTLSNLFGFEYDSRLMMGQDILSDAPPLVILSNRSFITDKVMYNSENGDVTKLTDAPLPEDYISNLNKIVKNKFKVSDSILKEDYYRYVFPDYPKDFK